MYYVEVYKVAVVLWKGGEIKSEEYRSVFQCLVDFIKKGHTIVNYFSDTRNQGMITPEDRKWFQEYVLAEGQKFGLNPKSAIEKKA